MEIANYPWNRYNHTRTTRIFIRSSIIWKIKSYTVALCLNTLYLYGNQINDRLILIKTSLDIMRDDGMIKLQDCRNHKRD